MGVSRRDFVARGSVIGVGLVASQLPALSVIAQPAAAPPKRRSLNGMALNDPILSAWREGVGKMKALPAANKLNWTNVSTIHGTNAGFNKCPHGNWYFLPWHRAYITMYERKVRELTGFPGFALPYWDWTMQPTLPPAFTSPTYNGQPNPLYVPGRTLTTALPPSIVGQALINQILTQSPYETFGTSRPLGQNSLAQSWITTRTGVQGTLEQTPHNLIHNRIGGLMPTTRSPLDPIFMMHHGNLDRLWAVWNAAGFPNSTDPLWTGMAFTDNYYNNDGTSWSPKVSELQIPENLGYTYGLTQAGGGQLVGASPQGRAIERFFALKSGDTLTGVDVTRAANQATATAARPLTVSVMVRSAALNRLAGRGAPSAGEEFLRVTAEAALPRVVAVIRNIRVTNDRNTEFRVFLNATNLSQRTPITDPSYVGTFGFFGGTMHAGHGPENPSVLVDLTDAIRRISASRSSAPDQLLVQLLPASSGNAGLAEVGTATPEAVELAVVS